MHRSSSGGTRLTAVYDGWCSTAGLSGSQRGSSWMLDLNYFTLWCVISTLPGSCFVRLYKIAIHVLGTNITSTLDAICRWPAEAVYGPSVLSEALHYIHSFFSATVMSNYILTLPIVTPSVIHCSHLANQEVLYDEPPSGILWELSYLESE